jgi:hypothetical protein
MILFSCLVQVCLPMHKAQCKFGNLWQLQIQLMAKALVEMASLKTRAAKLGADEFMCKLIQVKKVTMN